MNKMKTLLYSLALVFCLSATYAQHDPKAREVLDAMSEKYKNMGAYSAKFTQELKNESAAIDESITGQITIKDNMYLLKVAGQEIYNDGTNVYSFSEEFQEVTISPYEPEGEEITPGNIYNLYKDGFKYGLMSQSNKGDKVIELDPIKKDKTYFKIRLVIDAEDNLKRFTVFERSGNQYVYTIKNFQLEEELKDEYFTFNTDANPDVEVIDFR